MTTEIDTLPILPGQTGEKFMPASEVCASMRVVGHRMRFQLTESQHPMVQLFRLDGTPFSFPITTGEAGVYSRRDEQGKWSYYYHPNFPAG